MDSEEVTELKIICTFILCVTNVLRQIYLNQCFQYDLIHPIKNEMYKF